MVFGREKRTQLGHQYLNLVLVTTKKLKTYKSPGTDKILAQLFQAGGNTSSSEIHKVINSVWNKDELPQQWKESVILPVYKKGDETD